jgi:cytochrome c oxidase subunit 4
VVATILFLITIVEFIIIYVDALDPVVTPMLIILSAIKFATVVMFYMHLKFDSRLFSGVFVGGLALAFAVGLGLLGLFGALHSEPKPRTFAEANALPYEEHAGEPGGSLQEARQEPQAPSQEAPAESSQPQGSEAPSAGATSGASDPLALGKEVFTGKGTCSVCHTIQGISAGTIGPELTHVGTNAAQRKPGTSAEAYIRESIENPTAFVVEGFPPAMTPGLKSNMTDAEFDALVQFLLAQK